MPLDRLNWMGLVLCGALLVAPLGAESTLTDQGNKAEKEKDYQRAFELYKKASEQGDILGTAYLGHLYKKGRGVPKDYGKAREYFEKAIQMEQEKGGDGTAPGVIFAKLHLAKMYQEGDGMPKDYSKAFHIYQVLVLNLAHQQDKIDLQALKINRYNEYGRKMLGIALYHLGEAYKKGRGVAKNAKEALAFLNKAVDFGNRKAEKEIHHKN